MKRTLFAATIAAQVIAFPTLSFAAADAAADAKTQALIQRCIDNNLLLPEQVQTMTDAELNEALVDCAASLPVASAAPILRPAPVVVEDAPVVVHRRARFVAAEEPEFVGGGGGDVGGGFGGGGIATPININSNNNSGNTGGDGSVFGNGNVSGGNGGVVLNNNGNNNGNGNGAGAGNIKLTNTQKDALIGAKLAPGQSTASIANRPLADGGKLVKETKVTKLPNGNVRVTKTFTKLDKNGNPVGAPRTKTEGFTPADVEVFKAAHGDQPLDKFPSFAKKNGTFAGLKNGEAGTPGGRFAALRAKMAAARNDKLGAAAGQNGTHSRFAALREKFAAAKDGKLGAAANKTGVHSRYAEMRARMAAAKNGKLGTDVSKGGAHNRFSEMIKRRKLQTAQGKSGSSIGKIARNSDRGIFHPSRQAKSTSVKRASKIFAQHRATKAAKVAKFAGGKSRGGSFLRRFASR